MTENKRFAMIITGADGSFHYLDNVTGEKITSTLELESKLNELADENEQLRFDFKEMKDLLYSLEEENKQLKEKISDYDEIAEKICKWDWDEIVSVLKLNDELVEENQDNKTMIKFLSTENTQIMNELKTRTQIQHQLEEENEQLKQQVRYLKVVCRNELDEKTLKQVMGSLGDVE